MSESEFPKPGEFASFEELLCDYDAGDLTEENAERLRGIIRGSAELRKRFVEHQLISVALSNAIGSLESLSGGSDDAPLPAGSAGQQSPLLAVDIAAENERTKASISRPGRNAWHRMMLAAAASLFLIVGARWLYLEVTSASESQPENLGILDDEPTARGLAILSNSVGAQWAGEKTPLIGEALTRGKFALTEGLAQLEFFCGATVVLDGPTEFELLSPMHARVLSGRLRAEVPPAARGFTIDLPDGRVIDLGTEFGVEVDQGNTNIQVFDGKLEYLPESGPKRLLTAGEAVANSPGGGARDDSLTPNKFVDVASLSARAQERDKANYEAWQDYLYGGVSKHASLVALYAFDSLSDQHRRLVCDATSISGMPASELDGAIVGAQQGPGRWTHKSALQFKHPGDRVRLVVPGKFSSLTFCCWARIDSLDRQYNSLFLTDGYNQGEPHWQLLKSGQIYFSVRPTEPGQTGPRDHKSISPVFWNTKMSGKWVHLATTYDVETREVVHYVNGDELSRETIPAEMLVAETRIGAASIGNWAQPTQTDDEFAIRNLNGSIDELAVFSEALPAELIMEMYRNGRP